MHPPHVDRFLDDYLLVVHHVLHGADYPEKTKAMRALAESVAASDFPPRHVLARVVAWVCFMMQHHPKSRALTTEELDVRAAAWRLSDALHPRRH